MARSKLTRSRLRTFWSFVEKSPDPMACWLWTGFRMPTWVYALWRILRSRTSVTGASLRLRHFVARIPKGMQVLASMRRSQPVLRPVHLFLGTHDGQHGRHGSERAQARRCAAGVSAAQNLTPDDRARDRRRRPTTRSQAADTTASPHGFVDDTRRAIWMRPRTRHSADRARDANIWIAPCR